MCKLCLNCEESEAIKYSKYSNGNFCSKVCARAYSTKNNRKEISLKVSKALTGTGNGDVTKTCPTCNKSFTMEFKRRHRQFCSPKCSNNDQDVKDKVFNAAKLVREGAKPLTDKEIIKRSEQRRITQTKKFDKLNSK